jgi:hypothetical protein
MGIDNLITLVRAILRLEKDTCVLWKPFNRRAAMFLSSQACTNPGNVRCFLYIQVVPPAQQEFAELNQLTGIAAILTFPLDIEVVEAEEREEEEERARKAAAAEEQ